MPEVTSGKKNILLRGIFTVFAVPKKDGKGYRSNTHKKGANAAKEQRKNSEKNGNLKT